MKKLLLVVSLTIISLGIDAQGYSGDKVAFTNFLVRMYNNAPFEVGCSKFRYKSDIKSARIQLVKLLTFNTLYCEIVL